ncbi:hypothetical protein SAMN02982917_6414 [Azospirillum oryzae]|uniref:Uncharacterized protein n=1 Tax=Azospirillum oryzae TaxID=286727 RepID=A0A1X7HKY9_9PROT|nr:hypothetical protein SAMN02982917_6414 [Azospirillum oryzae]
MGQTSFGLYTAPLVQARTQKGVLATQRGFIDHVAESTGPHSR